MMARMPASWLVWRVFGKSPIVIGLTEPPSWESMPANQRQHWVPETAKSQQVRLLIGCRCCPVRWLRRSESIPFGYALLLSFFPSPWDNLTLTRLNVLKLTVRPDKDANEYSAGYRTCIEHSVSMAYLPPWTVTPCRGPSAAGQQLICCRAITRNSPTLCLSASLPLCLSASLFPSHRLPSVFVFRNFRKGCASDFCPHWAPGFEICDGVAY